MLPRTLALVAFLQAFSLPALAADFDERVAAEPGGRLRVKLDGAHVVVEGHAEDEVRVEALAAGVGARDIDFDLRGRGNDVTLDGSSGGWLPNLLGGPRLRVRLRVPDEFSVDVRTSGGSVELEDIDGEVEIRTSGGSIRVDRVQGRVRVETSGGGIEASQIEGDLDARTSGGPIRISEVSGRVDARTSGGSIDVLDAGGRVEARTSGGSIRVRFTDEPEGRLETSGGGIEIEIPEDAGLDLSARASGGQVQIDPSLAVRGRVEPNLVNGAVNGGGGRLDARTSGGGVRLHAR